jgi:hypothetical protein
LSNILPKLNYITHLSVCNLCETISDNCSLKVSDAICIANNATNIIELKIGKDIYDQDNNNIGTEGTIFISRNLNRLKTLSIGIERLIKLKTILLRKVAYLSEETSSSYKPLIYVK